MIEEEMSMSINLSRKINIYGNPLADIAILRILGQHEHDIEKELELIEKSAGDKDWCMITVPVNDWNYEMTPWEPKCDRNLLPPYLSDMSGGGAKITLDFIINELIKSLEMEYQNAKRCYIMAGYSLAGLFSLWSSYQLDRFGGIVAASPSVWYPGWVEYINENSCKADIVYLSLGRAEHKTRNILMAEIANAIDRQRQNLEKEEITVSLEWNPGNHFKDVTERMAKGISYVLGML